MTNSGDKAFFSFRNKLFPTKNIVVLQARHNKGLHKQTHFVAKERFFEGGNQDEEYSI